MGKFSRTASICSAWLLPIRCRTPRALRREAELISAPILFDNTPPSVNAGAARRNGSAVEVDVEARDAVSALRRAEYSLDAGAWVPMDPVDGVLDGLQEQFRLRVENLTAGEHLIVIRVFDSASNVGLTKVVVHFLSVKAVFWTGSIVNLSAAGIRRAGLGYRPVV